MNETFPRQDDEETSSDFFETEFDDLDKREEELAEDLSAKPLPGKLGHATFWNW